MDKQLTIEQSLPAAALQVFDDDDALIAALAAILLATCVRPADVLELAPPDPPRE